MGSIRRDWKPADVEEHVHYRGQCPLCGKDRFSLGESPNLEGCYCTRDRDAARAAVAAYVAAAYAVGANPLPHLRSQGRKAQWLGDVEADDEWRIDATGTDGQGVWVVVSDPRPKTGPSSNWTELGGVL